MFLHLLQVCFKRLQGWTACFVLNACKGGLFATDRPLHAKLVLTNLLQKKLQIDFILHWSLFIRSMRNMLQTDAG